MSRYLRSKSGRFLFVVISTVLNIFFENCVYTLFSALRIVRYWWLPLAFLREKMSLEFVKKSLHEYGPDLHFLEFEESAATVALAARALQVDPRQIGKTLSFRVKEQVVLIASSGQAKLDNKKYKEFFGVKAKMLDADEVEKETSHPVGGFCPFGVLADVQVYCDRTISQFEEVFPAGGGINAAVRINPYRLVELVEASWIDVTQ